MKQALIILAIMVMLGGCTSTNNPVSANSDRVTSGTLQYTLSTSSDTYGAQDTLNVYLNTLNIGTTTDTVAIGPAVFCTWSLKTASGDIIFRGANRGTAVAFVPLPPGKSTGVDAWRYPLVDSSGSPLPGGPYTFDVDYADCYLSLKVTVE